MPVDKQVNIRYEVLNNCFRDLYNEYTIDDLVEECNKALARHYDKTKTVSKRTVQDDIARLLRWLQIVTTLEMTKSL